MPNCSDLPNAFEEFNCFIIIESCTYTPDNKKLRQTLREYMVFKDFLNKAYEKKKQHQEFYSMLAYFGDSHIHKELVGAIDRVYQILPDQALLNKTIETYHSNWLGFKRKLTLEEKEDLEIRLLDKKLDVADFKSTSDTTNGKLAEFYIASTLQGILTDQCKIAHRVKYIEASHKKLKLWGKTYPYTEKNSTDIDVLCATTKENCKLLFNLLDDNFYNFKRQTAINNHE